MSKATNKKRFVSKNVNNASAGSGVYRLYEGRKVSYVGSSSDISERLETHMANPRFRNITSFDTRQTPTTRAARKSEQLAIKKHNPPQNHT